MRKIKSHPNLVHTQIGAQTRYIYTFFYTWFYWHLVIYIYTPWKHKCSALNPSYKTFHIIKQRLVIRMIAHACMLHDVPCNTTYYSTCLNGIHWSTAALCSLVSSSFFTFHSSLVYCCSSGSLRMRIFLHHLINYWFMQFQIQL